MRKKLASTRIALVINDKNYSDPEWAAEEISLLIKIRMRRFWENKIGKNPNGISYLVYRLNRVSERAYRRVLPICIKALKN